MLEQEFKQALRESMANVTTPLMNESTMLDAAKRMVRRRRAMWASGASALAVVALATGVALAAPGADRSGPRVGVEVTSTNPPSGTAYSGPHYEQGVNLLNKLLEVMPQGYDSPADISSNGRADVPTHGHGAVATDGSWHYSARISLVKAGKFGFLGGSVLVGANITGTYATPCALSMSMLDPMYVPMEMLPDNRDTNPGESCTEVTAAGKQVGVAVKPRKMLVTYLHSDGTLVILSEETPPMESGYPGLTELPFTGQQLAELAADPRFHLG